MEDHGSFAVISRLCVPSPMVKHILPAHVRSKAQQDVIFVYDYHLELYEFTGDGKPLHALSKHFFACRIQAAKVLELEDPNACDFLPPQLLVLKLSSAQLQLMYVSGTNVIEWHTYGRPLPILPSIPRNLSLGVEDLLTIGLTGSVIVVSSPESGLLIFSTNRSTSRTLDRVIEDDAVVTPPDMIILKIELLHPPASDPNRAVLVLLGIQDGRSVLYLYSWDTHVILPALEDTWKPIKHALGKEHAKVISTLLVPLKQPGAFMIFDERVMAIYQYGHDGSVQQTYCGGIDDESAPLNNTTSARSLLWTAYTRVLSSNTSDITDIFYLAREDGLIQYIECSKYRDTIQPRMGDAAKVSIGVDTAFATLKLEFSTTEGLSSHEYLLISGSGGNGAIYEINPDVDMLTLIRESTLPNWAPLIDTAVVPRNVELQNGQNESSASNARGALFVTSGLSGSGRATGCAAAFEHCPSVDLELDEILADPSSPDDFWVLDQAEDGSTLTLYSMPWESAVALQHPDDGYQSINVSDEPTLAAASIMIENISHVIVLTRSGTRIYRARSFFSQGGPATGILFEASEQIMFASISFPLLAMIIHQDERVELMLKEVHIGPDETVLVDVGRPVGLRTGPTCISFVETPNLSYDGFAQLRTSVIMVGYQDGSLTILILDGMSIKRSVELQYEPGDPVESVVLLSSTHPSDNSDASSLSSGKMTEFAGHDDPKSHKADGAPMLLLTAFRSGVLRVSYITTDSGEQYVEFQSHRIIPMSMTAIRLFPMSNKSNNMPAIAVCDGMAFQVVWLDQSRDDVRIERLTVDEGDGKPMVKAITAVHARPAPDGTSTRTLEIACSVGIISCSLTSHRTTWRIRKEALIDGTPQRLIYSDELQALIVGYVKVEVDEVQSKRYSLSHIYITKPETLNTETIKVEDGAWQQNILSFPWSSKSGERLTDILEWKWPKKRTSLMLVASFRYTDTSGQDKGLIKYIKIVAETTEGRKQYRLSVVHESREPHAVFAVCQYKENTLIYGCGDRLRMRTFDWKEKRFSKGTLFRLPSPAVYITAGQYLYVMTSSHSVQILDIQGEEELKCVGQDLEARQGISHLVLEQAGVIFVTTKDSYVTALTIDLSTGMIRQGSGEDIYRLDLPCSITRLVKSDIRMPWCNRDNPGILEQNIYGTAADGSLWNFSLVSNAASHLLYLLQAVSDFDEDQGRSPRDISTVNVSADPLKVLLIIGDSLQRLAERRDAAEVLESKLQGLIEHERTARLREYGNALRLSDVSGVTLMSLAKAFQGVVGAKPDLGSGEWKTAIDGTLYIEVIAWLRKVLDTCV